MAVTMHPDAAPGAPRWFPMRPTDTPVRRFAVLAVAGLAVVWGLGTLLFGAAGPLPLLAGIAFFLASVLLAAWYLRRHHPHTLLGLANVVTLFRLALVSTLVIPLVGATPAPVAIIVIAVISLSLDGVDGRLARRQGLSSNFGGRFDMEVDSVFALVLALLAVVVAGAGWPVILLGLPRYLFGIAGLALPWLNGSLPPRLSGKIICVVQLSVLIALQLPWFGGVLGAVLAIGIAGALVWSFGRDIVLLWRIRAS